MTRKIYLHRDAPDHYPVFSGPLVTDGHGQFTVAIPRGERVTLVVMVPRPLSERPDNWERGEVPAFVADRDRLDLQIVVGPIKR